MEIWNSHLIFHFTGWKRGILYTWGSPAHTQKYAFKLQRILLRTKALGVGTWKSLSFVGFESHLMAMDTASLPKAMEAIEKIRSFFHVGPEKCVVVRLSSNIPLPVDADISPNYGMSCQFCYARGSLLPVPRGLGWRR